MHIKFIVRMLHTKKIMNYLYNLLSFFMLQIWYSCLTVLISHFWYLYYQCDRHLDYSYCVRWVMNLVYLCLHKNMFYWFSNFISNRSSFKITLERCNFSHQFISQWVFGFACLWCKASAPMGYLKMTSPVGRGQQNWWQTVT